MNSFMPLVTTKFLGKMCFRKALDVQQKSMLSLLDALKANKYHKPNTLLLVEHPPVYTVGIRSKLYSEVEEKNLKALGADFIRTSRGGLITFHGPGQLVAYPILYLGDFSRDRSMKWYVSQLEKCIIRLCKQFDIDANTLPYTGVWVGDNKIASIGIHGSRFVTTHGVAINCNTDLDWFGHIVPCGIPDKGVTSFSKLLGRDVTVEEVLPKFLDSFEKQFCCNLSDENLESGNSRVF